MADLTTGDLQTFSKGRLAAADANTQILLDAALRVARREVGWHVSPVKTTTVTIDGPGSRILWLPSKKLVSITSITEDDILLDPATYKPSAGEGEEMIRRAALRKVGGGWWTAEYSGVDLVFVHGFTEVEAADWRRAVLTLADQASLTPVEASTGMAMSGVTGLRVDDVDYRYNAYAASVQQNLGSVGNVLEKYRIAGLEYL